MTYSIFFSPTGGTKKVCNIVAQGFEGDFAEVDLISKKPYPTEFNEDDICVIGAPAYGGRVPQFEAEKLKTLKGNCAKAVVVAVFGNRAIDDTLAELEDIAKEQGFKVIAGIEAVAEHSLAPMYGTNRPNEADKTELLSFVEKIKRGNTCPHIPGNRPYKQAGKAPMKPCVSDKCVNCKLCAKSCPVDAISLEDIKVIDTSKCFSCMHCVSVCPTRARQNDPEVMAGFEERLRDRASGVKPNKLYI